MVAIYVIKLSVFSHFITPVNNFEVLSFLYLQHRLTESILCGRRFLLLKKNFTIMIKAAYDIQKLAVQSKRCSFVIKMLSYWGAFIMLFNEA
ncbi:hypothetical protein [Klebsiella quasipneumoniae]|uniref:hypothetical protein n=1 Tax=Klebsiella quasipneumoniae TaxID=1463165 RepID=UPI00371739D5